MEDIKEKTADEMFQKLGYIKTQDNKNLIEYTKNKDGDLFEIYFWRDDNTISKSYYENMGYIEMQELQAINKKCKELGWI